jgi:uncharacterized membrane protein
MTGIRGISAPLNEFRNQMDSAQMPEAPAESALPSFEDASPGEEAEAERKEEEAAPAPPSKMYVINKADRKEKYDTYSLDDGRKLLVSKTSGNQFEQTTAGKNVYKKVPAGDLYDVSGAEPEVEAPAPSAPATTNAAAKEAAYQRFRADPSRRMLPTSYDKRIIDIAIDNPTLSQKDISESTGVSQSTVSRVLKSARGSY